MDKQVKLFQIGDEDGNTNYIVLNEEIKSVDKSKYPFSYFIDIIYSAPLNSLSEKEFDELDGIEKSLVEFMEKEKSIWIGHVTKKFKREIIFYSSIEIIPNDNLQSILAKENIEVNIEVVEDPKWIRIEAFVNALM